MISWRVDPLHENQGVTMNIKSSLIALAVGLAMTAGTAMASEKSGSYTFAEAGYAKADIKNSPVDADGAYLKGSYAFSNGVYASGQIDKLNVDRVDVDLDRYAVAVGMQRDFARINGFAEVGAERSRALGANADGYRLGVGVKAGLTDKLEGLAQINYRDGDAYSGDTSGVLGLRYNLAQNWSVAGQSEFASDGRLYHVGVRYGF